LISEWGCLQATALIDPMMSAMAIFDKHLPLYMRAALGSFAEQIQAGSEPFTFISS
jgi:hypothetical protein